MIFQLSDKNWNSLARVQLSFVLYVDWPWGLYKENHQNLLQSGSHSKFNNDNIIYSALSDVRTTTLFPHAQISPFIFTKFVHNTISSIKEPTNNTLRCRIRLYKSEKHTMFSTFRSNFPAILRTSDSTGTCLSMNWIERIEIIFQSNKRITNVSNTLNHGQNFNPKLHVALVIKAILHVIINHQSGGRTSCPVQQFSHLWAVRP